MGIIFRKCVEAGYSEPWQIRCRKLATNTGSPRNQGKVNGARQYLKQMNIDIDLVDLAALVSSTQSGSDINGTGGGNQFCKDPTTPFPFRDLLPDDFQLQQTPEGIADAYLTIQRNFGTLDEHYPGKEDIESALRQLGSNGEDIAIEAVLDHIEDRFCAENKQLPEDWRQQTQLNIEKWYKS